MSWLYSNLKKSITVDGQIGPTFSRFHIANMRILFMNLYIWKILIKWSVHNLLSMVLFGVKLCEIGLELSIVSVFTLQVFFWWALFRFQITRLHNLRLHSNFALPYLLISEYCTRFPLNDRQMFFYQEISYFRESKCAIYIIYVCILKYKDGPKSTKIKKKYIG